MKKMRVYGWLDVAIAASMLVGMSIVFLGVVVMIFACSSLLIGALWHLVVWAFT